MKNQKLQPFAKALREMPQGKPIVTVTNMPYGGRITMMENEDGTWVVATQGAKEIVSDVTPPDAYGMLYPLFARIHTRDL